LLSLINSLLDSGLRMREQNSLHVISGDEWKECGKNKENVVFFEVAGFYSYNIGAVQMSTTKHDHKQLKARQTQSIQKQPICYHVYMLARSACCKHNYSRTCVMEQGRLHREKTG
jgi:hypothetical protein